ncbi:MAG: ATP-binding protein, partial [Bacteroidota bacterium]
VRVSTQPWKSGTLLMVTDNGKGIPNSKIAEIFTIFTQLGRKKADQSGVGLAIVKQWIKLHRGNVSCESVPNEGSTFYCYFPSATDE